MYTIVKFSTKNCQPCKKLVPVWLKLTEEYSNNFKFESVVVDIDVDIDYNAAQLYEICKEHIKSVPSIAVIYEGKFIEQCIGLDLSANKYKAMLDKYVQII